MWGLWRKNYTSYTEYDSLYRDEIANNNEGNSGSYSTNSSTLNAQSFDSEMSKLISLIRQQESIPPAKSDLHSYLEKGCVSCDDNASFSALQ